MSSATHEVTVYEYVLIKHVVVAGGPSPAHIGTAAMAKARAGEGITTTVHTRWELGGMTNLQATKEQPQ